MRSFILRPLAALLTFAISLSVTWLYGINRRISEPIIIRCEGYLPIDLVDDLGESLARWSQRHGKIILIDYEPINYVSRVEWAHTSTPENPGCGLPDPVYTIGWDSLRPGNYPATPEWQALAGGVGKRSCEESHLAAFI